MNACANVSMACRMRELYVQYLFDHWEEAIKDSTIEVKLWRTVYYKVMEEFRKAIRLVSMRTTSHHSLMYSYLYCCRPGTTVAKRNIVSKAPFEPFS